MRRPAKKIISRDEFAAVFEEQTRRFSAFELLGLSTGQDSPTDRVPIRKVIEDNFPLSQYKENSPSQADALLPNRQGQDLDSNRQVDVQGPDSPQQSHSPSQADALLPNRQGQGLVQYRPTQGLTVDDKHLGLTVSTILGPTPLELGSDRQAQVNGLSNTIKILAPLQWAVWCQLQQIEISGRITSYRQIAEHTHSTADGVKKAINIIQKEGGIKKKEIIRSATEQGFRVVLNREVIFREASLNEAKGVLKRGMDFGLTGGGERQALGPDGRGMSVCKNINIKHTDIDILLHIPPLEWKIREQTLIQIAESFPDMSAIEFRLSLNYLVEQEKGAKEPIRNHNAWIKAAFEKNKGPLVTEREIEVRFQKTSPPRDAQVSSKSQDVANEDSELFRLYFSCSPDVRAQIDLMAETKAAPLLKIVAEDKRTGVLEEARREAAREFFLKKS